MFFKGVGVGEGGWKGLICKGIWGVYVVVVVLKDSSSLFHPYPYKMVYPHPNKTTPIITCQGHKKPILSRTQKAKQVKSGKVIVSCRTIYVVRH